MANMALKNGRKPDNLKISQQMTLSTKFNFNFATLNIFIKENQTTNTTSQFTKINKEKKLNIRTTHPIKHQTTFQNLLKEKYKYQENIKSS